MSEIYAIPQAGSTWQHRDGDVYTVIDCTSQPDAEKADKFPMTVFYRGPDGRKWARTLDSWRASFTFVAAAQERYPVKRILEHAEYLAAGTERFMDCAHELIAATQAVEEADDADEAEKAEVRLTDARESFSEALRSSRSDVHEFRKRAERFTPEMAPGTELDGALFRFWTRMAAEKPARVAMALIHCITPEDYRDSLTRLMESSKA